MFLPKDETGVRYKNYFLRPKFESEKGFGVWLWDIGVTLEQRKITYYKYNKINSCVYYSIYVIVLSNSHSFYLL